VLALSVTAALISAAGVSAASTAPPVVPTGATTPFKSANVTHVGTIPLEGVGVSMETRKVGKQVRAFVSGAGGLSIYDATNPEAPTLLGHLPFYNWENEDIAVSKDGKTAFLSEFQGALYLHAVDVSNPALPRITDSLVPGGAHTVVCADDPCNYLYGSEGQTYDVRDRSNIKQLPDTQAWGTLVGVPDGGHNLHEDEAGIWISDTEPLVVFEQVKNNPLKLRKITTGTISKDTNYQHNNIRPNADKYTPRGKKDKGAALRPGELLLGNGESNFTGTCGDDNGAFSTWSMKGFDKGAPLQQLDVLRPVSGNVADGDPAVNAMGCSGHWFTEKDAKDGSILVTAAWYEHGTRFLKVDPKTGKIRQVGHFQPVRGATSEAFWMPGSNVVWAIDYHSGIDILRFDESAPTPTTAQTDASWLAKKGVQDVFAVAARELCRVGASATPAQHERMHGATTAVAASRPAFRELAQLG
jgi:hypothetical protein